MRKVKDGSLNFYRVFNQKAAKLLYRHIIKEQIVSRCRHKLHHWTEQSGLLES